MVSRYRLAGFAGQAANGREANGGSWRRYMETSRDSFDLRSALRILRRRLAVIVLCFCLLTAAALVYSLAQEKKYSSTATLLFRDPGFDQTVFGAPVFQTPDPTREAATNVDLVSLSAVADRTARRLDNGMTASAIQNEVSTEAEGQSNLVSITATDPDPEFAAKLANTFADTFIAFRRQADRRKVASALRLVRKDYAQLSPEAKQGQEGQALQQQISKLSTLQALQTGNAELVQQAQPSSSPSSPQTTRNVVIGAILGLVVGLGLALLFERLDRRVKDPDELGEALAMPAIGTIPDSKVLAANGGSSSSKLPFAEAEAFRMLRTRLRYFNVDREVRSVLVTSASPKDGKSTVAWNLAHTAAEVGVRTLLIEADFHQPTIAARRHLEPLPGLAEILTHQCERDAAIQHMPVEDRSNGEPGNRALDLIVAGATPPNPAELLESQGMAVLLNELSEEYELLVIDTPPVALLADAIPLMKLVGGVLVVGQLGKTTKEEAAHLAGQLQKLNAPVLGVVANRARKGRGYGYAAYGYYYSDRPGEQTRVTGIRIGSGG